MDNLVVINRKVRNLILDYALGAAIIALLPLPNIGILKAIALLFLNYRLIRGIRRLWTFQTGGDFLARLGSVFGIAGSVLLALGGWVTMIALSTVVPKAYALASGVAVFGYFWGIGQTLHHYYLSSFSGEQPASLDAEVQDEV